MSAIEEKIGGISFTLENTQCGVVTFEDVRFLITSLFEALALLHRAKDALGKGDCTNSEAAMAYEACKKFLADIKTEENVTCTSTHCERRQECASPSDCTGSERK